MWGKKSTKQTVYYKVYASHKKGRKMQDRVRTKLWGWPHGTLGPFLSGVHFPSGSISAPWQALSALRKPSPPSVHRDEPPGKDNSKSSLFWGVLLQGNIHQRYLWPGIQSTWFTLGPRTRIASDEGLEVDSPRNVRPGLWSGTSHGHTLFLFPGLSSSHSPGLVSCPWSQSPSKCPQNLSQELTEGGLFSTGNWFIFLVAEENDVEWTFRDNLTQWFFIS